MQIARRLRLVGTVCGMLVHLTAGAAENTLPRGVQLPKDVKVPNDTALAVYLPAGELKSKFYVSSLGIWATPGKALEDARRDLGQRFFTQGVLPVDFASEGNYGLLLDIDPKWSFEAGTIRLEMRYKVYGPEAKQLMDGTQSQSVGIHSSGPLGGFPNAALKVTQLVLIDVLKALRPSAAKFPASAQLSAINRELLIDRETPVSTGTGFYINKSGQLMTAAHVLRECLLIEAQKDGQKTPVTQRAVSDLLDLAVVDTGQATEKSLPLRIGQELMLGEAATNVGYPLQGILSTSPNLTRGNVSAHGGLKGSVGLFQFSAPIQPGASGGPVVSDGGELLGITVGTLNAAALINEGLLPQNVNFALEARYAAMFLRNSNVEFTEVAPRADGSMRTANDAALGAVVQLSCYQ
jgi:serine protease Do